MNAYTAPSRYTSTGYTPQHCPYSILMHLKKKKKKDYEEFHKLETQP